MAKASPVMEESKYKRLLGEGPYPFSFSDFGKSLKVYLNPSFIILDFKRGMDFFPAQHMHT